MFITKFRMGLHGLFVSALLLSTLNAQSSPLSKHILDSYQQLQAANGKLVTQTSLYCDKEKKAPLKQVKEAWRDSMNAWMAAQHINVGPIQTENLAWSFQFWPDKKNLVKIKVDTFLKEHPEPKLSDVATSSVIAQGLSALEYLIYDPESPKLSRKTNTCSYMMAAAQHLEKVSIQLVTYWSISKNQEKLEVDPNKASEILNAVAAQIELSHKKMALPLSKGNPFFAESWRSKTSLTNIRYNLEGLSSLYETVIRPWVLKNRKDQLKMRAGHELDSKITKAFANSIKILDDPKISLYNAIQTKKTKDVEKLEKKLKSLKNLLGNELPQFLGVMIGFNSNDGD